MAEWIIEIKDGKFPIGKWTELVRCRDCAYRVEANTSDGSAWCSQLDGLMPPDWFCADGERKEE